MDQSFWVSKKACIRKNSPSLLCFSMQMSCVLDHWILCETIYDCYLQQLVQSNCKEKIGFLKNLTRLILKILTKWEIYMHTMVVYFLPFSKVVNFMGHLEKELRLQSKLRIKVFVNIWGGPRIKVSYWFNKVAEAILPCQHPEHISREALL